MKIIAHGKQSIAAAVERAGSMLDTGIKTVTIECVPATPLLVIAASTLAFCPTADCSECDADPCPFGHQSGGKVSALQAEYAEAEAHLNDVSRRLREANTHG